MKVPQTRAVTPLPWIPTSCQLANGALGCSAEGRQYFVRPGWLSRRKCKVIHCCMLFKI
jgi:hypothetical protein